MVLHRQLVVLVLISSCFCAGSSAPRADAPVVDVGYAQYQGVPGSSGTSTDFLGIRYAADPSGELRWRAPQPPAHVSGVQLANTQPNQCFQASPGSSLTNPYRTNATESQHQTAPASQKRDLIQSEDCLFLNVYVPGGSIPTKSLPVIVWIHGGGYIAGWAAQYQGEDLIKESKGGAIVVVIQYRLGLFGFLAGEHVKANGSLNAGLLDQHFALLWVHNHISKFGGDPSKVTIWGESAGAGSVLQHVVAQNGRTTPKLFRGAITSSTFLPSQYQYNSRIPETVYSQTVAQSNCTTASDTLACLRAADVNVLEAANTALNLAAFWGTFLFVPVVDGTFITQRVTTALAAGKVNGDALLAVTNTHEGNIFVNQDFNLTTAEYVAQLFPLISERQSARAATFYKGLGTQIEQLDLVHGEAIFICPTYFLLDSFKGRSFKGEFAIPPGDHGNDGAYYFPSTITPTYSNPAFFSAFSESFTSFATSDSLDVNEKLDVTTITPRWAKYVNGHTEMLFNKTEGTNGDPVVRPVRTDDKLLERCTFWQSVGAFSGQ